MKNQLIIFTRYPEPGKTKTRLVPALGDLGAAQIHKKMAENTVKTALDYCINFGCDLSIYFQGGCPSSMKKWLGPHTYYPQGSGDLGQRLQLAFKRSFELSNRSTVAIGTDCPEITPELLENAFKSLQKVDLVLGPAHDGGYYLVGINKDTPELFQTINWGTRFVLQQTIERAKENKLTTTLLKTLHDIDRPEDIQHISHHPYLK